MAENRFDEAYADSEHQAVSELIKTVDILRSKDGCAWDAAQTHESLVRYLIEESFETVAAIESGNDDELREELGDVLYQIVFHASLAKDREAFTIDDVAAAVTEKMKRRHPHVFEPENAENALLDAQGIAQLKKTREEPYRQETLTAQWEQIKRAEKTERNSVLDGIPRAMPALLLSDKLLGKIKDFPQLAETFQNESNETFPTTEDDLGEQLLQLVYSAKRQGFDAERALRKRLGQLMEDIRVEEDKK